MDWITSRIKEPSSWAAAAAGVVGIAIGGLGFLLKEKGVI